MWTETREALNCEGRDRRDRKCFVNILNQILGVLLSSKKQINFNSLLSVLSDLLLSFTSLSPSVCLSATPTPFLSLFLSPVSSLHLLSLPQGF